MKITGVATSTESAQLAAEVGVPIKTLDEVRWLDLTIDGADEYDANLNLIKGGGGGALPARKDRGGGTASDQMVVIADLSKQVDTLGQLSLAGRGHPPSAGRRPRP